MTVPPSPKDCADAPPPEWEMEPDTVPTGAVAATRAYKVVVAKVVPEGLREILFVNVLLFWLISKSVGAETVIAPVRFTPEIV